MSLHPLITHELSLARQDHLRREAAAARSTKVANGDLPANIRWGKSATSRQVRFTIVRT